MTKQNKAIVEETFKFGTQVDWVFLGIFGFLGLICIFKGKPIGRLWCITLRGFNVFNYHWRGQYFNWRANDLGNFHSPVLFRSRWRRFA